MNNFTGNSNTDHSEDCIMKCLNDEEKKKEEAEKNTKRVYQTDPAHLEYMSMSMRQLKQKVKKNLGIGAASHNITKNK